MEQVRFTLDARERQAQRASGAGTQSLRLGLLAFTPEWERTIAALPTYFPPGGIVPAQNADGTWNLGIGLYPIGEFGIS